MEIEKEMLRGHIDIIILAMLHGEDLYGYELAKRVKEQTEGMFELKEGTLYLAFKRMEQSGLVESYWGGESVGGRRKYYQLCTAGRQVLFRRKQEWELLKNIIDLFLKEVDIHE